MHDAELAGQTVTGTALRQYYLLLCHQRRMKPFGWLAVLRQFNPLLRRVYGADYHKTYGNCDRKRRTYRIPTPEEVERALADPEAVVELAERRRA